MNCLNTVLGTLHPEEMGTVAVREHILWGPAGWELDPGSWFPFGKAFETSHNELVDFRLRGGLTVVDGSGIGWGRDVDLYVKLAAATGVNLIASTGFWSGPGVPPHFRNRTADEFEALFVHELTVGMGHTGVKAGVISIGNDGPQFTDLETAIYRGAARAARATGAAVLTHGIAATDRQIEIFEEEGLDLSRVVIGDSDRIIDPERDHRLIEAGATVAYDNVGLETWSSSPGARPDDERVELIVRIVRAGHGDRVMMSAGSRMTVLGRSEPFLSNIGNVMRYFVPKLLAAGLSQAEVDTVLCDNPKRVLPMQRPH